MFNLAGLDRPGHLVRYWIRDEGQDGIISRTREKVAKCMYALQAPIIYLKWRWVEGVGRDEIRLVGSLQTDTGGSKSDTPP
jgi:hypothetical protein